MSRDTKRGRGKELRTGDWDMRISSAVLEAAPVPVIVSIDGEIALVNEAARQMLGYTPGQLAGKPLKSLVPSVGEDVGAQLVAGETVAGIVTRWHGSARRRIPVEMSRGAIFDEASSVCGVILIGKDLRPSSEPDPELERRVEERTGELEKKVVELERFTRVAVGRELRMVELKREMAQLRGQLAEKDAQRK